MRPIIHSLYLKRFKYQWAADKYQANLLERETYADLIFSKLIELDPSGYYASLATEKRDDQLSNMFDSL